MGKADPGLDLRLPVRGAVGERAWGGGAVASESSWRREEVGCISEERSTYLLAPSPTVP